MQLTWPFRRAAPAERKEFASIPAFLAFQREGEPHWTRRDYASMARAGYMANPVAHRAIKLVAETAAGIPWLAFDGGAELAEHPMLALVARPNQRQAGAAFLEALIGHLLISGNAYVELLESGEGEEAAREMHLLRPDRVTVVADAAGWPVALEHREGAGKRRVRLGQGALHIALFHPLDDHYGLAPLEAALAALDTHNAAGRWNKALLDNSARPSGALVYAPKDGGKLEDEQFDKLKAQLENEYQGPGRAGRPLLLEGGLDWKQMSLTPKDMDFIEAKNAASRDIALALGVPPMLLGIPGDNTYANYQEANRAFWRLTVMPLAARIAQDFTAWLRPTFGETLRLEPDWDQAHGLSADRDALWARVGAAGFLTDEEKREAVGYGKR